MIEAEKYFPFGVNIGWGEIQGLADRQGLTKQQWLENAFDDLKAHHINTVRVYNLYHEQDLDLFVSLALRHNMRLVPQGGNYPAYFPTWISDPVERNRIFEELMKPAYAGWINTYRDSVGILTWDICEETPPEFALELKAWTDYIDGLDPNHPARIIYSGVANAQAGADIISPRIIGGVTYPFFVDPQSGPTTPSGHLSEFESMVYGYYQAARSCGAPLWVTGQGMSIYRADWGKWIWRYPTPNEMRLQAWVALVNGAKGISYWVYTSSPEDRPGETIYGLVDRDGNPTPAWDAIGDLWFEIKPFTSLIPELDESDTSIITSQGGKIRARTFQKLGETDRYIIVANTDIENVRSTELVLDTVESIYRVSTSALITPSDLFNSLLLPGGGDIYKVGGTVPEAPTAPMGIVIIPIIVGIVAAIVTTATITTKHEGGE